LRQRLADHSHRQRGVRHDSERCPANASTRLACRSGPYSPPIKDRTSSSRRPPKHPAPTIPGPLPIPQRSYKLLANRGYPWVTKNEGIRETVRESRHLNPCLVQLGQDVAPRSCHRVVEFDAHGCGGTGHVLDPWRGSE